MTRFLLDANLSPQTAAFLSTALGVDVIHVRDLAAGSPTDDEVAALAVREHRVIITLDTDFGEMYVLGKRGDLGVIVLKLRDQTPDVVNTILARFLAHSAAGIDLDSSLVILDELRVRVIRPM